MTLVDKQQKCKKTAYIPLCANRSSFKLCLKNSEILKEKKYMLQGCALKILI